MFNLYILDNCPYCKKVRNYLDEHGIKFEKFDISNENNAQKLLSIGGKIQVPFLEDTINNYFLYESDDIIEYVKNLKKSGFDNV